MEEDLEKDLKNLMYTIELHHISSEPIQNLIARYKDLEQKYSNKLISFQKEREEYEKCLEAEESYSKSLNNDIKSLLHIEPNDNFILKSKVKEEYVSKKELKRIIDENMYLEMMKELRRIIED